MASRKGKHKKGKVRMGIYVEPFRKAVAVFLAKHLHMTMTDVIWLGIDSVAKAHGILTLEGKVAPKFKAQLDIETEIVKQSEVNS